MVEIVFEVPNDLGKTTRKQKNVKIFPLLVAKKLDNRDTKKSCLCQIRYFRLRQTLARPAFAKNTNKTAGPPSWALQNHFPSRWETLVFT